MEYISHTTKEHWTDAKAISATLFLTHTAMDNRSFIATNRYDAEDLSRHCLGGCAILFRDKWIAHNILNFLVLTTRPAANLTMKVALQAP